jgi:hypothetical protein
MEPIADNFRYIDAGHLNIAAGALEGTSVALPGHWNARHVCRGAGGSGQPSVRYLVVESRHWLKTHRISGRSRNHFVSIRPAGIDGGRRRR